MKYLDEERAIGLLRSIADHGTTIHVPILNQDARFGPTGRSTYTVASIPWDVLESVRRFLVDVGAVEPDQSWDPKP